jgi:hypothetical protein
MLHQHFHAMFLGLQVYTYNLRPMGHLVRMGGDSDNGSSNNPQAGIFDQQQQQQQQRCSGRGSRASCDSCDSNAAVTGYELQLVMEYCPMVSCWIITLITCYLLS